MLPIRDDAPRSTTPYVTYFLIALNLVIYFFEWQLGPRDQASFLSSFALIPLRVTSWVSGAAPLNHVFFPFFSSMFLHANWPHVIVNVWFLAIFGDNVEDRLGHFPYMVFYLACGLAGNLAHFAFNVNSQALAMGASGAIAGVMGAYFLLYPRARVLTWWVFFVLWLPAWLVLGYWFLWQFLSGVASVLPSSGQTGGIAFWAHVGGFACGLLLIKILPTRKDVYAFEDY